MNFTTKIIHQVSENDLSEAVSRFYGQPYSAMLALEAGNGESYEVTVTADDLDQWDADKLKAWEESGMEGHSPEPAVVMSRMVRDGLIPAGEYIISVSW